LSVRSGADQHDAVDLRIHRALRVVQVVGFVEDDPAIRVDAGDELRRRSARDENHRHRVLDADREIVVEAWIRLVDHEADAERRIFRCELELDVRKPLLEARARRVIERRQRAEHATAAGLDHGVGSRYRTCWHRYRRDREPSLQDGWNGHGHRMMRPGVPRSSPPEEGHRSANRSPTIPPASEEFPRRGRTLPDRYDTRLTLAQRSPD